jgi:hypothetical protein
VYLKVGVSAAALIMMIGQVQPASVRPTAGRPGCRIFPTAGSQVTVSPIARSVVTYKSHFDRFQVRIEGDTTMTDNLGTHTSYKTATQWDTIEDFVNEVVRSSGYRGQVLPGLNQFIVTPGFFERSDVGRGLYLSSAFSETYRSVANVLSPTTLTVSGAGALEKSDRVDWSINTIPPLRLSKTTKLTGDTPITRVNSFDAAGRLIRFVNTVGSTRPIATDYTAWDRVGRPTSGSIVTPDFRQTVTMVYDDAALTQITTYITVPTGGATTTSVMKETFDQNGNTLIQEWQTPAGRSTTTMTFETMDVICTGPIQPPSVPKPANAAPLDPGYPVKGTLEISIDGERPGWQPAVGLTGKLTTSATGPRTPILAIGASDSKYSFGLGVNVTNGAGTYAVLLDSAQPQKGLATAHLMDARSKGSWQAGGVIGRGTVTLTTVSPTGASGSFNIVLTATPGTGASGTRTIIGTFNITF